MRWFAGTSGGRGADRPTGARVLWDGPDPLWLVGNWPGDEVRTLDRGGLRMVVLGVCAATDAELEVGLAVARGGALRHLTCRPGSYHVVLRAGRRTVVLGDVAGVRQVYSTAYDGGTVYGSHALPLADLTRAGIDTEALAARLACPDVPEAGAGRSLFTGVARVEPGHALELDDGTARVRRYEQHHAPLGLPAAASALREALTAAVDARVAGARRPGADLSGGRDSAVPAILAARAVARDDGRDLIAVTWAGPGAREDTEPAARIAAAYPRMRHLVLPGDAAHLPYAGIAELLENTLVPEEPGPALIDSARVGAMLAAVRTAGVDAHLTGHGGEAVFGSPPARLADLAMDRRQVAMVRHARGLARRFGMRPYELVGAARRVARTGLPDALRGLADGLEGGLPGGAGPSAAVAWCRPGAAAGWLTPASRGGLAGTLRGLADELRAQGTPAGAPGSWDGRPRPGDRAARIAVMSAAARQRVLEQLAERSGVRLHAPHLDSAVVRVALSPIAEARYPDDGPRALPAAALEGLVPRGILAGTGRRDPRWAEPHGLRRAMGTLRELFADPLLGELGLIDPVAVRRALDRVAVPGARRAAPGDVPLAAFAETAAAEVWLRGVWEGRVTRWDATPTSAPGITFAAVA